MAKNFSKFKSITINLILKTFLLVCGVFLVLVFGEVLYLLLLKNNNGDLLNCETPKNQGLNLQKNENFDFDINSFQKSSNYNALKLYVGKLQYKQSILEATEAYHKAKLKLSSALSENERVLASCDCEKATQKIKKAFFEYRNLCESCVLDEEYKNFTRNFTCLQGKPQSLLYSNLNEVSVESFCLRLDYIQNRLKTYIDSGIAKHCSDYVYNNVPPMKGFSSQELIYYFYEIKILYDEIELLHNWLDVIPEYADFYYKTKN